MVFAQIGGPQYRPQIRIILTMGTPKKDPDFFLTEPWACKVPWYMWHLQRQRHCEIIAGLLLRDPT